jgi:endonuclease/exonuclease/phosphatase family metal-dependent hydrolase
LKELGEQIEQWINEGLHVIVCGDFNEDVWGPKIINFFTNFNMTELIISQHGLNTPNTYIDGSIPIDGIFGTQGIESVFSGYSSFSWGMHSDHQLLWIDLDMNQVLGTIDIPLWKPNTRRLQCKQD